MPLLTPKVAIIGAHSTFSFVSQVSTYSEVAGLLTSATTYDVLILDVPGRQAGEMLRSLRIDRRYHFNLIYCGQDQDSWCIALADGAPPVDLNVLQPLWRLWRERFTAFSNTNAPERFEARVLAWLWLRSHGRIMAVRDASVAQHYRYPLLEALGEDESHNAFTWLQLMVQQGWLEDDELIDRLRLCIGCGSGRLNYVDVCAECHSLEIARQPSLHCFTCGHVAAQEHFVKDGVLLCPNCMTRLRHIGSDYDRPLENFRCRSCQAFFVDAEVEARCLDCGKSHAPDKLRIREVRHFKLSETGRLRCRQGYSNQSLDIDFGKLGLVNRKLFASMVDWQLQLVKRYKRPGFALLGLRFVNISATVQALGDLRGHALIDAVVERLQESVRETDRCSRLSEEVLWILMPHADAAGLDVVRKRISAGVDKASAGELSQLEVRQIGFVAPDEVEEHEDAALLLARLTGELG